MKKTPFLGRGQVSKIAHNRIYEICKSASADIKSNQCRDCLDVAKGEMPDIIVQEYSDFSSSLHPDEHGSYASGGSGIQIVKKFSPNAPPHLSDKFEEAYAIVMREVQKGYIVPWSKCDVYVVRNTLVRGFVLNTSSRQHLLFLISHSGGRNKHKTT